MYTNATVDEVFITGQELEPNVDIKSDHPDIMERIKDLIFIVTISVEGDLITDVHEGENLDEYTMAAIDEMAEDHVLDDGYFYDYTGDMFIPVNDSLTENSDFKQQSLDATENDLIVIRGADFPEAFEGFSVDKWVVGPQTNDGRIEYEHRISGYNEDGEYVVYLNMPFNSVHGTLLVHEIKHAYDDWNRMSKGYKPLRDGWEIKNIYTEDFEKLVLGGRTKYPLLMNIVTMYYLGSKLETHAYLENVYDLSHIVDYKDVAKKLMNFKVKNFTNKKGEPAKGLQDQWSNLLIDHNIPLFRKYPNVMDFLKYTEKYFNHRGNKIFKKIGKMMYIHDKKYPDFSYYKKKYKK
jgi:hypothetical protein